MTDVRHLHFGEPVPVNALADFSTEQARKQQAVFLGKDEQGQPVLVPRDTWRKTNIQILGLPGSGKSAMATNALIRCVRDFGDAVVYFDPKGTRGRRTSSGRTARTSPCWICGRGNRRS
ncbi:hypothetical protein [Klebsiella pneumoniae]|uniref:hypothetical protein n=1 Tax=Klebsiella pneumoniae TaxID=573 RepID=UPI0023E43C86|nr:hypothetical protein [Klebsiella pneumoniae]